ncbi:MAG: UDP-glucose 4-epimerase [uncultured Thermomicrobiales bacterium]|uniref:UDP-glucose 4-epimerase n=1 Tax=uncultured Thermomicrobiales bacterium TaxID=1645740 RepID=A0A6J4TKR8_9BACT|nr:MAG: UDP-glucose 4-epimerase [uncultured Thermomicrobiales bacterium]
MRVLVTGGVGYIGSVAVERLLLQNHDVVVLDNVWRGHPEAVAPGVPLVVADLRDRDQVARVVREARPDAILHFAAATLVGESMTSPADYFAINTVGSHNLLEEARANDVERVVFSSTASVYGMPDRQPVAEGADLRPINPYGRSKLMVEQMLEWYGTAYGLRYACLRYFNVAGATRDRGEDHDPETHIIPVALLTLLGKRDRFTVFGTDYPTPDGTAIRDYVHVVDLADAHLLALANLDQPGEHSHAFNLGTKDGFSVKQIVDAVERVTGRALPIEYGPRRAGDPPVLVADSTRARAELGWDPALSNLDQMIGSAWDWFQRHPNGYGDDERRR